MESDLLRAYDDKKKEIDASIRCYDKKKRIVKTESGADIYGQREGSLKEAGERGK